MERGRLKGKLFDRRGNYAGSTRVHDNMEKLPGMLSRAR